MEHSKNYEKVKRYYNMRTSKGDRMWDETRVRNAVEIGWITAVEFKEITGNDYE